ncbi:AbrB/MazE/SpoVT family DNA-binding domain-containing protein [Alicyclobacillus sp. SP_1]|jgi:AbrB family looped-hinge helix DNA binding protein|uniref:AbrB/MazE/SpoVT family DNA-binding domain-containing protein n=1 Tax=Alicyclobacillus sp. SP_1 TaxID=2942475 RepID=UPI0021588751|nr:AbrB/MazE/SpoVT family DNA-binding domain-containing protein [Alicyclobacillus sp. SP_1]
MTLSKVTRNGQITIPKSIREKLHLEEGDYVEVIDGQEGILLRPKKVAFFDPDQAYYWTEEWQERERRADEDIREGRVHKLDSLDELDS